MCGAAINLFNIDCPAYVLATREDHIVPWKTAYASIRLLAGDVQFILAASGHIAGVINPASRHRRNYWLNDRPADDPDQWLAGATSHPGSWWTHWSEWLGRYGGARIASRTVLGGGPYDEVEPAPGRYVREKCG
jgi:polyhydroxyalkanoate synthase